MAFNIFSTLNQNLQNFWGDAYDAYQAWKSKVGNVASTINNNLQDFWGDIYDVGSTIKKNVSDFWTQTYNQGKNVASTIKKNVWDYATGQINEIKAIPSQIGQWFDNFKQGARDLNYQAWNAGMKALTGKNNATFSDLAPNLWEEMSRNTGKADEEKISAFVNEIMKGGYNQDQALQILDSTLAQQPDFFNKQTYGDKIRKTAVNRGREFGKTYQDFSTGKIGFGEATLRNAGDIVALWGGVIGDTITQIPWVTPTLNAIGGAITSIPWVKPWMEAYGSFAQANPRAAQNIEAITNLWLSALGSTEGQALMKKWANVLGRKVAQGADYIDNVTSPITTPISNSVSKWVEKMKSIVAPINADEQILKDAWLKTVKGMVWDKIVEVPTYGVMDKARSIIAPAETKRLVNRALSPRWTGLWDKQKLASVVNAEKNVRNYHQLVRSGKLKGDLSSLESTAQSVVDNLDEVWSKIGKAVDKVQANVAISDDAYKAIDDAVWARWASRTPTAKILENFKEDTAGSMTLKEAFDIKKIYQTEVWKLIRSGDAGTPQYSALVKWVEELTNQIDNAIETQLKWSKFKELKSQYRLMKSMVGDITNSAMVEWRRSPQTFVEQLGTIEAMWNILSSPIATGRQFLAKEIGEMNTRGGSWRELVKRLDNEAVNAYKKSQTNAWKVMKREMENLPVATKPPIVPKAKPKATTESAFKSTPVVPEKKSIVAKKESTVKTPEIKSEKVPLDTKDFIYKNLDQAEWYIKWHEKMLAVPWKSKKDIKYLQDWLEEAKREASIFKNNKGFINPSEIKKSLVPKKWADEARQFYDDLVYAGNSPIVAQRETAKRFGTIRAMSASKAGTAELPVMTENWIKNIDTSFWKYNSWRLEHKNWSLDYEISGKTMDIDMVKVNDKQKWTWTILMKEAERIANEKWISKIQLSAQPLDNSISQKDLNSFYERNWYIDKWNNLYIKELQNPKSGTMEIHEALVQEAKKYKSADEFIKSKATLLHWSPKWVVEDFSKWKWLSTTWDINNPTYHFTNDIEKAKLFSRQWELDNWNKVKNTPWIKPRTNLPNPWITKAYLDIKNPYVREKWWDLSADFIKKLKSEWYDGIINDYGNWKEYIVFNTSQIKTESQLKQIYEQANKPKATNKK